MTDKEKLLGREVAKLALKIRNQRSRIRQLSGIVGPLYSDLQVSLDDVRRENSELNQRISKLTTENRALRIFVAEEKINVHPTLLGCLRLWLMGRE